MAEWALGKAAGRPKERRTRDKFAAPLSTMCVRGALLLHDYCGVISSNEGREQRRSDLKKVVRIERRKTAVSCSKATLEPVSVRTHNEVVDIQSEGNEKTMKDKERRFLVSSEMHQVFYFSWTSQEK